VQPLALGEVGESVVGVGAHIGHDDDASFGGGAPRDALAQAQRGLLAVLLALGLASP
jgi:hypothetical protein